MESIALSQTGLKVSPLGMGVLPSAHLPRAESIAVIRGVADLGIHWFDVARGYGDMEERLGEALAD